MTDSIVNQARQQLQAAYPDDWEEIVQTLGLWNLTHQVGKDLTSFMAFPQRGEGGDSRYRGNCSPKVIEAVLNFSLERHRYAGKKQKDYMFLDPMSGSGTSVDVAEKKGIQVRAFDLNPRPRRGEGGFDALKNEISLSADCIFFHPPYDDIVKYSGKMWGKPHPDDLSRCSCYGEYMDKLNFILEKLMLSLRKGGMMAVLVGDIRKQGTFHSIANDMLKCGKMLSWVIKGQFHTTSSTRVYSGKPFIPIVTEHLLIFEKTDSLTIPFSHVTVGNFHADLQDAKSLTWFQLVRLTMEEKGSPCCLEELYEALREHPKSRENSHFKERIRASIYEHNEEFIRISKARYRLSYLSVRSDEKRTICS